MIAAFAGSAAGTNARVFFVSVALVGLFASEPSPRLIGGLGSFFVGPTKRASLVSTRVCNRSVRDLNHQK